MQAAESPIQAASLQAQSSEWRFQDCQVSLWPRLPSNPVSQVGNFLPTEHSQSNEIQTNPLRIICRLQNHKSKLPASMPAAQSSEWRFQDCKVSLGTRLPCNPVSQGATGRQMPPDPGPLDSMKSTQIHIKSKKIDEIHRKSSQGHQIPQESMKSTQIHFIEAACLHVCRPPGSVIRMEVPRLQGLYGATTPV